MNSAPHTASSSASTAPETAARRPGASPGRLMIDAPMRAFHWLFALSFTGAWITAESERWRDVHLSLGYAFGGLLLFRLLYGLVGPRQASLRLLWHRVSGAGDWLRAAGAGRVDPGRAATLGMGAAMLLLLLAAAPLVLSGYAGHIDAWGMEDAMEELHEFFANASLSLVLAHLALIAVLSVLRRRNLAAPMLSGRVPGPGPDLVRSNRVWLAWLLLLAYVGFIGFIGWQGFQDQGGAAAAAQHEPRHGHADEDDD